MLRPGTPAPDLVLLDHHGRPFTLSQAWHKGPAVIFFYPKADTPVCTKEVCGFRDHHADLSALDVTVLGISRDGQAAQQAFADRFQLPYALLCDTEGAAHRAYGVHRVWGLLSERITYIIDQSGVVRHAHSGLFRAERHVREALEAIGVQRRV